MDKYKIIIIAGVLVIVICSLKFGLFDEDANYKNVCFGEKCVDVEIPDTAEEFSKGLMFRESLGENEGMLFIFDSEGKHGFWMKNTLIPLDIIWVDEEFKIVHIETAVPCEEEPCVVYQPEENAKYVVEVNAGFVEVNAGFAEENGVGVGDLVRIS